MDIRITGDDDRRFVKGRLNGCGAQVIVRRDRGMLAVLIVLDVAFHAGRDCTVSAAGIAQRAGLARRGIEPVLQALSRSGLLESVRGPRGGYRLGRPRRDIRLDEVLHAALADEGPGDPGLQGPLHEHVVDALWGELDRDACARLHGLTIEDLVRRAEAAGLQRPRSEAIAFSI